MPETARRRSRTGDRRIPRTYRLSPEKIGAAQRALGAATATEAIERALDLVVFQRDLVEGTKSMLGVTIESPDPDE